MSTPRPLDIIGFFLYNCVGDDMRLDRFISSQRADISRKDVKKLCLKGRITVSGKSAKRSDMHIDENSDTVELDGVPIVYREHIYIMLNKPQGVVCATRDKLSETVLELLPTEFRRRGLFPAGRLDKDTEGFVMITDDGELAHKMLSPAHHVPKTYFVRLEKPWEDSYAEKFKEGFEDDEGGRWKPARFEGSEDNGHECLLTITEGRYHQVKRMFSQLGNRVVFLKRTMIGELALDPKLPLGGCLEILHKDVDKLLASKSL